jgi:hypothetical protein
MCRKVPHGCRCNGSRSIRHSTWVSRSHLILLEVLILTYHIVRSLPAASIAIELQVDPTTVTDWTKFCREAMLEYVSASSQKLGGPGKTMEIDESCFGRREYNRGRFRNPTCVFGGSGRTFLIPVPDRSADTLRNIIHIWIEPGTTIISDCWRAYRRLGDDGYKL